MQTKSRLKRIEQQIQPEDGLTYTLDPFGDVGKEVTVTDADGTVMNVMSAEAYWDMKPDIKNVTVIDPFMQQA